MINSNEIKKEDSILEIKSYDQYRTVDELFKASKANSIYYTLLVLSSIIVAAGIILSNSAVIIGGMLVTPVLTPLLMIALGITTGELDPIRREAMLVLKSFLIVILVAFVLGLIFHQSVRFELFENSIETAVLYFIIALAAGAAGTFAWSRKEMAVALPGIAIAVSLVPPMARVGVALSSLQLEAVQLYFFITVFNLFGVILGSMIVFSLLKFHKAERQVHEKEEQEKKDIEQQKTI